MILTLSLSVSAQAYTEISALNTPVSITIYGSENSQQMRAIAGATPVTTAKVDKKWLQNNWRAEGTGSLTSDSIWGVTWDLSLDIALYKDGSYYTSANKSSLQTDYISDTTKWVSGEKESQFGAHSTFSVKDDNGIHLGTIYDSSGYPFN